MVAHFHPNGRVPTHLLEFLAYLRQHVNPHIVFVSTGLSDEAKALVEKCCPVIRRENFGYDFWSYKVGIEALPHQRSWKRWVLINSSIVIANPALLVRQLFARPLEGGVLGLTFSEDRAPHVQSYCVVFEGEKFIQSDIQKNWWNTMQPISNRDAVIGNYEVGMSQYFIRQRVPVRALYQPTQNEKLKAIIRLASQNNIEFEIPGDRETFTFNLVAANKLNPTHFMWDSVFKQFGIVKIDFLLKSIFSAQLLACIQDLKEWKGIPVRELINDALI